MNRLNPEKLFVDFQDGVTATEPIIPRRYTLTHSDLTAELFLVIGKDYAYDNITEMRDEVLGEWIESNGAYFYNVYIYIGDYDNPMILTIRNSVFRRELPLALEAIRYGDSEFFSAHPQLDYSPIIIYFISSYEQYSSVEAWGTFSEYV